MAELPPVRLLVVERAKQRPVERATRTVQHPKQRIVRDPFAVRNGSFDFQPDPVRIGSEPRVRSGPA